MLRILTLMSVAGVAAGIASVGSATPAEAGRWCRPAAYSIVYYGPRACRLPYGPGYLPYRYFPYNTTTLSWPVGPSYRVYRRAYYGPIRRWRR
jgi:hypothetical protein